MGTGTCLYGAKRRLDAPPAFTVDTGVGCFLFGLEHYLCRYLDLIVAKGGGSVRGFIKALIKAAIGQVLEGDIETDGFCAHGVPPLLDDINYADVFTCFEVGACDDLLTKITSLYHFRKWYEFCECNPLPEPSPVYPYPSPYPFDPNGDPIIPPDPAIPVSDCAAYFRSFAFPYWMRDAIGRDVLKSRREGCAALGNQWSVSFRTYPPEGLGTWEEQIPGFSPWKRPDTGTANNCNCLVQRQYLVYPVAVCSEGEYDGSNGVIHDSIQDAVKTVLRFWQTSCQDDTDSGGLGGNQPPPEKDFYPDFPWLKRPKKRKGGSPCGCCGSQWRKNPNELYLPTRYKV